VAASPWRVRSPLATLRAVKISPEEIRHVAMLARLELAPGEEDAMATTLDAILTYMEKLDELDTTEVEPTAHIIDIATPWREDRVTNAPDTDALLRNAPARDDDFFRVPKIIE
jgi:aspartyl-tRNA(Asn)/glutamyl-tRNA(Gln) amidotransferase subunit C